MANVGTIDRGIRLVIGIAALAAVFVGPFAGAGKTSPSSAGLKALCGWGLC